MGMKTSGAAGDPNLANRVVEGLAKVGLVFRHQAWRAAGERGLTPTQAQILATIAASPTRLGVKAVASRMALTAATASDAIATLVDKGLLRKEVAASDGRAVQLRLTPKGRREVSATPEGPRGMLDAVGEMPESERVSLLRGLVSMIRTLQERGMVPTGRMCVECVYFRPNEYPGQAKAHHCRFIGAPIGDADLRIDCGEMQPADEAVRPRLWEMFVNGRPLDEQGPGGRRSEASVRAKPRRNAHPTKGEFS